jgi:hypothetical protein
MWSMDDWKFVERQVVVDPKDRRWTIALMDVLGQDGDPEVPNTLLELQHAAGRYVTLIYSGTGAIQREQAYPALDDARRAYDRLLDAVADGRLDPSQPTYREDLEDGN